MAAAEGAGQALGIVSRRRNTQVVGAAVSYTSSEVAGTVGSPGAVNCSLGVDHIEVEESYDPVAAIVVAVRRDAATRTYLAVAVGVVGSRAEEMRWVEEEQEDLAGRAISSLATKVVVRTEPLAGELNPGWPAPAEKIYS